MRQQKSVKWRRQKEITIDAEVIQSIIYQFFFISRIFLKMCFISKKMLWHDFWIETYIQKGNHIFCWHLIYSLDFTSSKNLQLSLFHPVLFFTFPFQLHRVLDRASSSPANEICFVNNWYALLTAQTGLGNSEWRRNRKLLLKSTWVQKCEIYFMTTFYIVCCCSFDHFRRIHVYICVCVL